MTEKIKEKPKLENTTEKNLVISYLLWWPMTLNILRNIDGKIFIEINNKDTPTAICGSPYRANITRSINRPNLDLYWDIIITTGVATNIAAIEVTDEAANDPTTPPKAALTSLPALSPLMSQ